MSFKRLNQSFSTICLLFVLTSCTKPQSFEVVYQNAPIASSSSSPHSSLSFSSSHSSVSTSLPASVLIKVPFASQAPLQNWDALHQEACEEASLILVHHFLQGTTIDNERMEIEIQNLVAWEQAHGYKEDVTVTELGQIGQAYYGHVFEVLDDITVEGLKNILASGQPVIIPAAGRDLGNPYFSGEGPWYHMLVLIGYDENGFITNDVGTKRGASYHYSFDTFLNAIHDWTGVKEEIRQGPRLVLVVKR
jgi:uncharacterized protein YvpB